VRPLGSVGTTAQACLRVPIGVGCLGESLSKLESIALGLVVAGVAAMTVPARRIG